MEAKERLWDDGEVYVSVWMVIMFSERWLQED